MVWVLNVIKHFYHTYPHMINLILHQSILCKRATVIWNFMCFKPRFSLGKWWGSHRNIAHKGATTITKWSFFPTRPHDIHVCGNSWTTRIHQKTSNRLCVHKKNDAKLVKITWHDELCRENDPHLSICRSDTFIYLRNIATFHGLLHSQTWRLSALVAWTSFVHFTLTMGLSENGLVGPFQGFQMNFGVQGLKII